MILGLRLAAISCLAAAGCGPTAGAPPLGPPSPSASRAALVASLDAWKGGRRGPGLIGSKPGVGVVDGQRAERPLLGFEVLGPLAVDAAARPYAVRLDLGAPAERVEARYLVLGDDPLWVFRREDYDLILHWEHKMDDPDRAPADAPR